jgi:hypothetical protein
MFAIRFYVWVLAASVLPAQIELTGWSAVGSDDARTVYLTVQPGRGNWIWALPEGAPSKKIYRYKNGVESLYLDAPALPREDWRSTGVAAVSADEEVVLLVHCRLALSCQWAVQRDGQTG